MMQTIKPQSVFMRAAIADAQQNITQMDGGPFGACVVCDDRIVATARNTVLKEHDPTCHAEVNAIRAASRQLGTHILDRCTIYSTTEPCPMCFSAIHWARIPIIVFGTRINDVQRMGFHELAIENTRLIQLGRSPIQLVEDFMRDECLDLLAKWQNQPNHKTY